jgi:1-acyl-sn-glycerol-3-phosphate acyltransferase
MSADAAPEILTHRTAGYWTAWAGSRAFYTLYFRERFEGRHHVPASGGVVVLSNHQSFLDIPLLSHAVPRHVSFVARDTLANFKPLAWLMHSCGAVLIKRGAPDRAALREMVAHLEQGDVLVIFPEGTRTHDGHVQEFRAGALLAARMAKVPIVPCGIRGAFEALPRHALLPRPRKIGVRFGAPLDASSEHALEAARSAIVAMVGAGRYRDVPPTD